MPGRFQPDKEGAFLPIMSKLSPASISGATGTPNPGASAIPQQIPFEAPALAAWLLESADKPAADRKSFRLRLAVRQHELARGLALNERADFSCLERRQLEPADAVIEHALAMLRDLGPRALVCDEDGDAVRQAMAVAAAELIERGQADSLLVLCPAANAAEWVERLESEYGLPARLCGEDDFAHLRDGACWVIDHATAAQRAQQLADREFGILLIDEAHEVSAENQRALRRVLNAEQAFVFARSSSPMHDGFATLHRALDLVRGQVPHPLGPWEEFVQTFLQGEAQARFVRRGAEEELRARLAAWMRRRGAGPAEAGAKRPRRTVKEHLVETQPREKEYLELAFRAALGFPEGAREHYLAAALGGPWHFADAVEKALSRNLVNEAGLKRMLQDLVVRGRNMRETAKTAELATLARKALKDREARILVCVRSAASAAGVGQALSQAGLIEHLETLREGNDGLNRLAIQRFTLGERRILLAPDAAARGQAIRAVTELVHFDLPLEPADHAGRLEHLGAAKSGKTQIRRFVLKGTAEDAAINGAQTRLGFHELEPDEVSGWLADLGFADGARGWLRFLLGRAADWFQGAQREEELLPLIEKRKAAESGRAERRRNTDRVLGDLVRTTPRRRRENLGEPPRFSVAQLVAASLELRTGGWHVTDDKRILLEEGGQHFELRTPDPAGRTLARQPAAGERVLVCEPGSWAWQRLTAGFREGSRFFLADARNYPLDRVARKLQERLAAHGLLLESVSAAASEPIAASTLQMSACAASGPERQESLFEVRDCAPGHKLEAYLDAPETLPAPDGSRLPMVSSLDEAASAALAATFQRAGATIEGAARERGPGRVPAACRFAADRRQPRRPGGAAPRPLRGRDWRALLHRHGGGARAPPRSERRLAVAPAVRAGERRVARRTAFARRRRGGCAAVGLRQRPPGPGWVHPHLRHSRLHERPLPGTCAGQRRPERLRRLRQGALRAPRRELRRLRQVAVRGASHADGGRRQGVRGLLRDPGGRTRLPAG